MSASCPKMREGGLSYEQHLPTNSEVDRKRAEAELNLTVTRVHCLMHVAVINQSTLPMGNAGIEESNSRKRNQTTRSCDHRAK